MQRVPVAKHLQPGLAPLLATPGPSLEPLGADAYRGANKRGNAPHVALTPIETESE